MGRRNDPPQTCTVELSTGSFVHLACEPGRVYDERLVYETAMAREPGRRADPSESTRRDAPTPLHRFERVTGMATAWREVYIDVTQVVAVYPIAARPEAPMVYSVLAAGGMVPQGS